MGTSWKRLHERHQMSTTQGIRHGYVLCIIKEDFYLPENENLSFDVYCLMDLDKILGSTAVHGKILLVSNISKIYEF